MAKPDKRVKPETKQKTKDKEQKHPGGRPTDYSEDKAQKILELLMSGVSLNQICKQDDMPSRTTLYNWLADARYSEFLNKYRHAREIQAEHYFDEMMDIADNSLNDWVERETKNGQVITVLDHEHVQRSKLRIDTRKFVCAKLNPKKYGEASATVNIEANSVSIKPSDVDNLSIEDAKKALME